LQRKPIAAPAALNMNETIEPIIPGKAPADFLANSFNHSANFFNPSFTLSGILGSGGLGLGGLSPGGFGIDFGDQALLIDNPKVIKNKLTADITAATVNSFNLKIASIFLLMIDLI
jgi:hypothetical protein